ncbi:hypothetical protein N7510_010866 [Penicillium lagena]|uniref:uncharacterized protein n=1 Tax=Penicillium lagena TaxID=94218 RepID=UPI0025410998|nr:uncharacterized protein N7510_010866 [Penicillium lagena]KAJ5601332.1 hypothetical protein N7510_010866 [Penicillium lagena]
MGQKSSQMTGEEESFPEAPHLSPVMEFSKKKKKSRSKRRSSPLHAVGDGLEAEDHPDLPPLEDADESAPKRKRDSEPAEPKKKKKKRHAPKDNITVTMPSSPGSNGVSFTAVNQARPVPESQQVPPSSQPENSPTPSRASPDQNGEEPITPQPVQHVPSRPTSASQEPSGERDSSTPNAEEKKRKANRRSRRGKNDMKVGFFTDEEVQRMEGFKLAFCAEHQIEGPQFDMLVQFSQRGPEKEFPLENASINKAEFWSRILGTLPDREKRSVYRFMRRHFQASGQKAHDWTPEQDKEFIQLVAQMGPKWKEIANMLGRSDDDVTQRWKNRLEHRDKMRHGAWEEPEIRLLLEVIEGMWRGLKQTVPESCGKDMFEMDDKLLAWGSVSDAMGNIRSRQQCADRYRKLRSHVRGLRVRSGDPNAMPDLADTAKKNASWNKRFMVKDQAISLEYVQDEGSDEDSVGDDVPAESQSLRRGFSMTEENAALASSQGKKEAQAALASMSQENAKSESEVQATAATDNQPPVVSSAKKSKKRKHAETNTTEAEAPSSPAPEADNGEQPEKKRKKKKKHSEATEAEVNREDANTAVTAAAEDAEHAENGEKRKKKKKKSRKSAASELNGVSDNEQEPAPEPEPEVEPTESIKKRKKKSKKNKDNAIGLPAAEESDDEETNIGRSQAYELSSTYAPPPPMSPLGNAVDDQEDVKVDLENVDSEMQYGSDSSDEDSEVSVKEYGSESD